MSDVPAFRTVLYLGAFIEHPIVACPGSTPLFSLWMKYRTAIAESSLTSRWLLFPSSNWRATGRTTWPDPACRYDYTRNDPASFGNPVDAPMMDERKL